MRLGKCAERARLSRPVVNAIAEVHRAKEAYDAAKQKRAENVDALEVALQKARQAGRAAKHAFAEHTAHGCQR
jgi:hypothetical protein